MHITTWQTKQRGKTKRKRNADEISKDWSEFYIEENLKESEIVVQIQTKKEEEEETNKPVSWSKSTQICVSAEMLWADTWSTQSYNIKQHTKNMTAKNLGNNFKEQKHWYNQLDSAERKTVFGMCL